MVGIWGIIDSVILQHGLYLLIHDVKGYRPRELEGPVSRECVRPERTSQEHIRWDVQVAIPFLKLQNIGFFPEMVKTRVCQKGGKE